MNFEVSFYGTIVIIICERTDPSVKLLFVISIIHQYKSTINPVPSPYFGLTHLSNWFIHVYTVLIIQRKNML